MRRITSVGQASLIVVLLASAQDNEAPKTGIRRLRASTPLSLDSPRNDEHMDEGLSDFLFAELGDEDETFWIDLVRRSAESMSLSMSMPNIDSSDDNCDSTDGEGDGNSDGDGNGNGNGNGEGGDGNGTALSFDCDAVRAGTAPTSGPSIELRADVNITFDTKNWEAGAISKIVYTVMNDNVRFWMLGCDTLGRRLVEATMINVMMNETREAATCDTSIKDTACVSFDTPTVAIYTPDGGNVTTFQGRLDDAIVRAVVEGLFAFNGLVVVSVPGESGSPDHVDDTGGAQNFKEGLSTPGIVGMSVTALALFLLAALLVKRRRTTQDNERFAKQISDTNHSLDDNVSQYSSSELLGATKRLVVGDNESLENISDGIVDNLATIKTTSLGGLHAGIDVHVCQSLMCEACAQWKQARIAFVKIGTPSSPPCNTYQMATMNAASLDFLVPDTLPL